MPILSQHSRDLERYVEVLRRQLTDAGLEPAPFVPSIGTRADRGRTEVLSEREREVIALVAQGLSNRQVAERMYLSIDTVKTHLRRAYRKLGLHSRSAVVRWYFTRADADAA